MRNYLVNKNIEHSKEEGIILLELLIVLMIMGILLAGAVKTWDVNVTQARFNQTKKEMEQLVYAIVGNPELFTEGKRTDFGYVGDMGVLPESLGNLVVRPTDAETWRGPYIKSKFTENPDDYLQDAWGNNYIYNKDSLTIRSYTTGSYQSPQTWININIAKSSHTLLENSVSGQVTDLLGNPPGGYNQYLRVFITYPYNGKMDSSSVMPLENGYYQLTSIPLPQGNHRMYCIYDTTLFTPNDTTDYVEKYACIYPGLDNTLNFRLTVRF
jgi:type II secretory pathway pseudopilin PulG